MVYKARHMCINFHKKSNMILVSLRSIRLCTKKRRGQVHLVTRSLYQFGNCFLPRISVRRHNLFFSKVTSKLFCIGHNVASENSQSSKQTFIKKKLYHQKISSAKRYAICKNCQLNSSTLEQLICRKGSA